MTTQGEGHSHCSGRERGPVSLLHRPYSNPKPFPGNRYKDDLGNAIVNFARTIPDGLLVFFASYIALEKCVEHWKARGAPGEGKWGGGGGEEGGREPGEGRYSAGRQGRCQGLGGSCARRGAEATVRGEGAREGKERHVLGLWWDQVRGGWAGGQGLTSAVQGQ